ncbi:MAG: BNR repeat-containing protein [Sedimentisphaerales bacterium]|nr:BNR repeat-containing protein [Sedimentisphaerales bacterium]
MKRSLGLRLIVIFLLFFNAHVIFAFPGLNKLSDSVVDPCALTIYGGSFGQAINGLSFQQDPVITHNGYQYVAYYNFARHVCVACRELPSGSWEIIELTDYYFSSDDAHNVISMGICPDDSTIHLSFDHHGGTLHYRFSDVGVATDPCSVTWNSSLFSSVRNYLESGKTVTSVTYPAFLQTPDGSLHIIYRAGGSGNGDWVIADYNGSTHLWSNTRMFISRSGNYTDQFDTGTSRCAYPNYYNYGPKGKLHVSWCWRESTQRANHDLMYSYSDDGGYTWYNDKDSLVKIKLPGTIQQTLFTVKSTASDSNVIGDTTIGKAINLNSPGVTVVNINRKYGLMNEEAQAVDSQGRPHIVVWHCSDQTLAEAVASGYSNGQWGHATARRYHHYWRGLDGIWHHNELDWISGNRPKLVIAPNGDAFLVYAAPSDPVALGNGIYFTDGTLTIAAATEAAGWSDWQIIHTEAGYFLNEFLFDPARFADDEILAVFAQEEPSYPREPTPLRIIEFQYN